MNNYNENSKEVQELKSLIQDYFNIKNKGRGELNNKNLLSSYLKDNENKSYILDKYEYYNALHNMSNMEILWQETNVTVIDMQINRNNAIFDVYEEYKYQEKDVLGTSSIGTFHTIVLIKENGKWMITDIKSNDEFDRIYKYKGFNLQKELKEIKAPLMSGEEIKKIWQKETDNINNIYSTKSFSLQNSWVYTDYDRDAAVNYALKYSDTTYDTTPSPSRNKLFVCYESDCQNFASQCVFAGFGGDYNNSAAINNKSFPMIATGNRQWWATGTTSSYNSNYGNGWNWANCIAFGEYFDDGGYQIEGPYGWIHEGTVLFAYPGDIIQIREGTSGNNWYHSYVVTSVKGTQGGLTPDDIYVCSHTVNLNNIKLSTRCSNAERLRVLRISGHYSKN